MGNDLPTSSGNGSPRGNGIARATVQRWLDQLRSGFWFLPAVCVGIATVTALVLIAMDRRISESDIALPSYTGGPRNASDILTTIAASMITFTGLVFSITVLALQLTSSQFSPRALRNFMRDRQSQIALGVFVSTFVYAFIVLSTVRSPGDDDESFVPALAVTGAFLLVAASVVVFVQLIHHTTRSLRVVSIIDRIAAETHTAIERVYPDADRRADDHRPVTGPPLHTVVSTKAGSVTDVDLGHLAEHAVNQGMVAEVRVQVGEFVCHNQPIVVLHRGPSVSESERDSADGADEDRWRRAIRLAPERTMRQDVAFGLRQLVDIAERALSTGVNDPSTAVQCLERIHDLLRTLATRPIPTLQLASHDGVPGAWMSAPSFNDLLSLSLDEIRHAGSASLQVHRKLDVLIDDLMSLTACLQRREALIAQQHLLASRRRDLPATERNELFGTSNTSMA
jgi:uncharacterized membrane protein